MKHAIIILAATRTRNIRLLLTVSATSAGALLSRAKERFAPDQAAAIIGNRIKRADYYAGALNAPVGFPLTVTGHSVA